MEGPMLGVAVAAMRWHHARLRRIEAERRYKDFMQGASYRFGAGPLADEMAESRRMEARYKRRLSKSCEMASDKPKRTEIIDI
jgi:hypothetical protein